MNETAYRDDQLRVVILCLSEVPIAIVTPEYRTDHPSVSFSSRLRRDRFEGVLWTELYAYRTFKTEQL